MQFSISEVEKEIWFDWISWRRPLVFEQLEIARQKKEIGKSLDAKVVWLAGEGLKPTVAAQQNLEDVRELFNISQLKIETCPVDKIPISGSDQQLTGHFTKISVSHADGQKCERCWHWETSVGQNAEHPTLCSRCIEAVKQSSIPKI
jgi:isoleucyl-tRNA synthetase